MAMYNLSYDAENHMIGVTGPVTTTFTYNGDGQRVIATEGVTTTIFVGSYSEWDVNSEKVTKYYFAGAVRIAMREGTSDPVWLLGDHLGSTSVAASSTGTLISRMGFKPWGETRFVVSGSMPTEYQYTGQCKAYITDGLVGQGFDLYLMGWRHYDPELGRFIQPDTIIPGTGDPLAWDRYQFVLGNPVKYRDPSGHKACDGEYEDDCDWFDQPSYS